MLQMVKERGWCNSDNEDFYNHIQLNDFVELAGLSNGLDVQLATELMGGKDQPVLEMGAGTGRVVGHLLARGYQKVHALERSNWVEQIHTHHRDAVKRGHLKIHHCALQDFQTETRFSTILWLFCGITDFSGEEQLSMLRHLTSLLDGKGRLIVDIPLGTTNANSVQGQEHAIIQEGVPTYRGHVPTSTQMEGYAQALSYGQCALVPYVTTTGRSRALCLMMASA